MPTSRRLLTLVPDALFVEGHEIQPDRLVVHARARSLLSVRPTSPTSTAAGPAGWTWSRIALAWLWVVGRQHAWQGGSRCFQGRPDR